MEITLEKIELVKDRTGVSYKEAKEALEAVDGSVVDAIINIEDNIDKKGATKNKDANTVVEALKDLVKKGNVSKITIKNTDGEILLNVPVTVGILGVVIAPWAAIAGVIASFGFKCIIEVVKDDGTIIDVSDKTTEAVGKAAEKGSDVYNKVKNSETYGKVKEKTGEAFTKASETIKEKLNRDNFTVCEDEDCDDCDVEDCEKRYENKESEGEEI